MPDSCCKTYHEGCGHNVLAVPEHTRQTKLFSHGCLEVMGDKITGQVVPILLGYAGVGTLLALIQLITIVFACSYSAQITRKANIEAIYEDARSLAGRSTLGRGSTYRAEHFSTGSLGGGMETPRVDRIRGGHAMNGHNNGYMSANMSSVFINDDGSQRKLSEHHQDTDTFEREV